MFKAQEETRTAGLVISLKSFEHFAVISIVVDSFSYNNIESLDVHFRGSFSKFTRTKSENQIVPQSRHFHGLYLSSIALDQSAREKSLSYNCKTSKLPVAVLGVNYYYLSFHGCQMQSPAQKFQNGSKPLPCKVAC